MRDIKDIRKDINDIDREMRELFARRMAAAKDVAEYKAAHGLPILDAAREREVIEKNATALECEELRPFYVSFLQRTMEISRSYQDRLMNGMRVAYSGVAGAFAYIAACKLFPTSRKIAYPNFEAAYNACVSGECDTVVLPIENSFNGEVGAVTDLMFSGPLKVNGIIDIDISHCLLGTPDASILDIKKVISHPQALAQCKSYIRAHGFTEEEFENTALAAEEVQRLGDKTVGAIASESAASLFGLKVIEKNINESRTNTTRFAVFSRSEHKHEANEPGIHSIILFTVKNEAGALAKALDIIGKHNFNMRTLRSRPMKALMWQYYFYIEAEGNANTKEGRRMLEDLEEYCDRVKMVGSYVK
ncbi:MAG: bifunctional chorismate mutase/prephenate dehydratase [Ruminococcaceae bacterium]|nr:bifunctional chorismate mutase/prephenate dehydratase [Oscillospiraceae bacterium]